MKKLFTAILLCLLSATCIFSFTACKKNVDDPLPEEAVTVTVEEWETALSAVSDGKRSIECKYHGKVVVYGDEYVTDILFVYDKENEIARYDYKSEDLNYELYCWRGSGGKYYVMGTEASKTFKQEVGKAEFETAVKNYLETAVSGEEIIYEITDKFGEFTYGEESKDYKGNLQLFDLPFEITLKFENGKLVKFDILQGETVMAMDFNYNDIVLTVPKEILDMPVVGQ